MREPGEDTCIPCCTESVEQMLPATWSRSRLHQVDLCAALGKLGATPNAGCLGSSLSDDSLLPYNCKGEALAILLLSESFFDPLTRAVDAVRNRAVLIILPGFRRCQGKSIGVIKGQWPQYDRLSA